MRGLTPPAAALAALAALIVLTGCAVPPSQNGLRDQRVPISSAALFDARRFAGDWSVVGAADGEARCGMRTERWTPLPTAAAAFRVEGTACGPAGPAGFSAEARLSGPGRISRIGPAGAEELWVLWVDADYRVAVIGTPSGAFARILAREAPLRPDLWTAALRVLSFNGYDLRRVSRL